MVAPQFIYKVASREVYETSLAAGVFAGQPVDLVDGYVHFSTATQLAETIRRYFAGLTGQVLFEVPAAALGEALRWEVSRGGELFPHLHGTLQMSAISNAAPLDVPADGKAVLPDWVR